MKNYFKISIVILLSCITIFLGMIVVKLYISSEGQISVFSEKKHSVICTFKEMFFELDWWDRNHEVGREPEFQIFTKWVKNNNLDYRLIDNKKVRIINISTYEEAVSFSLEIKKRWYEYLEQCYVEK